VDAGSRFEQMYRAHGGAVRTYARRRSDTETADDVVADVFVVAWRRLDKVPDGDPLPWLLGVARRALANHRRAARRQRALRRRIRSDPTVGLAEQAAGAAVDQAAFAALEQLDERDREVLLLVAWEGLTPARAAVVLGIRPNTFSARLSRARRRFERALDAEHEASIHPSGPTSTEVSR
jgi:RNA polymerase sigma factor (sigma-70 family)